MLLFKVILASWRQQWRQILLVIFGLLCASAGLSSVLALNETAQQRMSQLDIPFAGKPEHIAKLATGKSFDKSDYARLLTLGWQVVGLSRFNLASKEQSISMVAMDVTALLTQVQIHRTRSLQTSGQSGSSTSSPAGQNVNLSLWQTPLASSATVKWFEQNAPHEAWSLPSPVGITQITDNNIYLSMALAGTLKQNININELWIFSSVNKSQAQTLTDAGFDVQLISADTGTLTDSFYINITAMGLLMFSVSMFISLNAYHLLFSGRKTLIKQLYFMGVNVRQLQVCCALESNLLTLICCSLGFIFGLALAELISPGMELTLRNLYDARFTEQNVSFWQVWITVVLAGLLAANLILWFPLNHSLGQLNCTANKHRAWHHVTLIISFVRQHSLLLSIAVLFAIILTQQLLTVDSLLISFLLITGCVLCGCIIILLLIPKVLVLMRQNMSPKQPLLYYFCADAIRLSDKSKIAMCAFFIAITANIGMNLMVGSFRQATDSWINQQFVADFYLSTNETENFYHWASSQHNLDIYHRAKSEIAYEGRKTEVLPMPDSFQGHLPLMFKAELQTKLTRDNLPANHIFINEQMSIRHQLRPEQAIRLGDQDFIIAGIYYDYGNMFNQILVTGSALASFNVNNTDRQLFSLMLKDNTPLAVAETEKQLKQLKVSYFSGKQIKDISMKVFEQTFVITSGLNLITLLVAGASLATSILIIESQNNQQTQILHQMGISDRKIWLGSLVQYSYLISVVFLLSVPFGILLSYQLINNINYTAFQWSYPLQHDLVSYGFVYVIALLTVLLAVSLPFVFSRLFSRQNRQQSYG